MRCKMDGGDERDLLKQSHLIWIHGRGHHRLRHVHHVAAAGRLRGRAARAGVGHPAAGDERRGHRPGHVFPWLLIVFEF